MANHFSNLALKTLWTVWKRQKNMTLKDELPRSVGAQYAAGDKWRNNSRMNEDMEPKWKQCPVVDVTSDGSKVQCCKEQYCIWTWNVRSMNQGKLEVIKQEMARVNINILGISKLKWTEMGWIYFHQPSHPQLGVVFALALSLHSFWSYSSTLFQ